MNPVAISLLRTSFQVAFAASTFWICSVRAETDTPNFGPFEDANIQSTANGDLSLDPTRDSLWVTFEDSPELTRRLREALANDGFAIADQKDKSTAVLTISGKLSLLGGRDFHRGVQLSLGEAVQKTLVRSQEQVTHTSGTLINAAMNFEAGRQLWLSATHQSVLNMGMASMVQAIMQSTGLGDQLNSALTGDPRGICFGRACEKWKLVTQTVYLTLRLNAAGHERSIRVMSKVVSKTVAPQALISHAFSEALARIKPPPGIEPANPDAQREPENISSSRLFKAQAH